MPSADFSSPASGSAGPRSGWLSPAAEVYLVGQPIPVRVVAVGRREATIKNAEAGLIEKIWYGQRSVNIAPCAAAPDWNPRPAVTRTVVHSSTGLDLAAPSRAGVRTERDVVLSNWASAPSGGRAPGRRIEYRVRAVISFSNGSMERCPRLAVSAAP
jgi:hypothetical protein